MALKDTKGWGHDLGLWYLDAPPSVLTPAEAAEWAELTFKLGAEVMAAGVTIGVAEGDRNAAPPSCPQCAAPWEPDCGCRPREGFWVEGSIQQFRRDWLESRTIWIPDRQLGNPAGFLDVRDKLRYLAWHDYRFHGEEGLDFSHVQELVAHYRMLQVLPAMSESLHEVFVNMTIASVFADHHAGRYIPCCGKIIRGRAPMAPWLYAQPGMAA